MAVFSPNSVEYIIALLSVWRAGASVMPISIHLAPDALSGALKDFGADFIFYSGELPFKADRSKAVPLNMLVSYAFTDGFFGRESSLHPDIDLGADAAVVLTSGSTGRPKGVLLSYGNLLLNAEGAGKLIPFLPSDRWLLSLPLWHVSGLSIVFRSLNGGGAIAVPGPDEILEEAIERYRPTHLSLVPAQLRRIMARRDKLAGHSIKAVLLGGAPIPASLAAEAVMAGLPVYATYGLTEAASQVATGPVDQEGSAQVRVLPGRELMISADGEVLVRGGVVFRRYAFGDSGDGPDPEGWYHTGDKGQLDEDGRLTILGRSDNMFISGGENVHPENIEKALLAHPLVDQALVVGISDEELGARAAAFVSFRGGSGVPPGELMAFLRERLSRYEVPKTYYVWPSEEKSPGLKMDRRAFLGLVSRNEAVPLGVTKERPGPER